MSASHGATASPFNQPRAVWAVAFACVISFMGIGLVDPILPSLRESLGASPSQISLLFTSYLVVTAVMMLVVGWFSSRVGPKATLAIGLVLIVVFAALAGASNSIGGIVGFRAGWGVGNALFISTSLAVIVASATGGFAGAIILYETALGVGIAVGPLLGGLLGNISWRGPFFGVSVLMAIAMIATLLFVPSMPKPKKKTELLAPIKALRHRGLLIMGIMALLYNWGFFTLLGYAPYPMNLDAIQLGLVFTGWGALVALFSVWVAPRLQARFGTVKVLYANMAYLAALMVVIAVGSGTPAVVIVAVIASGAGIGLNNTLTTQAVMLVAPVERSVASSAYGFVRFIGGGLAPFVAGKIAEGIGSAADPAYGPPFFLGAFAFVLAIVVLASGAKLVTAAEKQLDEPEKVTPTLEPVGVAVGAAARPIVVAVGALTDAGSVVGQAAELATREQAALEIVHVRQTEVIEDLAIDAEDAESARAAVRAHLDRLAKIGVQASGVVVHSVGDHASIGHAIADHARAVDARAIALGRSSRGALAQFADGSITSTLAQQAERPVLLLVPGEEPADISGSALAELRKNA
ncbi:MAG: MFS transporter [Nocardioides sp.]|uniref:MFS transporter n=1 Tax=Nocardioides sp. TaxID=35761 RepID=UPI0039E3457E